MYLRLSGQQGESNRRKPSSNHGMAEPQYPISVNAVLLPLCDELMVQVTG